MKNTKELRELRGVEKEKITAIQKKAEDEKRSFTEDETKELRKLMDSVDAFTNQIEVTQDLEKRAVEAAAAEARSKTNPNLAGLPVVDGEEKELRNFSFSKLLIDAEGGPEARNVDAAFENEVMQQFSKGKEQRGNSRSFNLPDKLLTAIMPKEFRAMTAGAATAGGNFIQTDKVGFFDALFNVSALAKLNITRLTGLSSNVDLRGFTTSVSSAWTTEQGSQTPTDAVSVARNLSPELLYTACDVSRRLIFQTNPSIDQMIMADMIRSMAQKLEQAVINGSGSGQPNGILGFSGVQSVAIGTNGGAPTFTKVLELITAVLQAGEAMGPDMFLTNNKVVQKLKQTTIDGGSGAMVMGYNNLFASLLGVIDGYEVVRTANVPSNLTKGSSTGVCSALIFGDFSQYVLAQFGTSELIVDPYTAARTATIQYTINQSFDGTIKQPGLLGAIQDLTTT